MHRSKWLLLLGIGMAGFYGTVLAAPAAMAASASGPALMTHGDGPPPSWHRAVTAGSTPGLPGWQIALIVVAAALVVTLGDRALTKARDARGFGRYRARRRSEKGIAADSS